MSILLRKMQDPNVPRGRGLMMGQELVPRASAVSVKTFVGDGDHALVDGAVYRGFWQLALHQIHTLIGWERIDLKHRIYDAVWIWIAV